MKLKIKSSLGAPAAACLLSILPCLSQGNVIRPMIFLFDPAVKGGNPTLKCRPSEHAEDTVKKVRIVSFALDTKEAVLQTSDISAADTVSFVLPNRGKDDFLGVRVEDITSGKPVKIAEWHAMYKKGKSLLDYKGSPKLKKPADFKAYWDRTRKELAACPMNATITPVPERNSATGNLYKVTLNSFGNVTIACWYFVPKDVDPLNPKPGDKKYPAQQLMPGWGGEMGPVDRTSEGLITLSLNPRGHGPSNDYFPLPPSHHTWNIDNPETYYYRAAYMDCVRGIDFLSSRPEVNHSHIGAEGNSQGGALTVAVAALDPRITCACSNVTYLSNFWDFGKLGTLGSGVTFLEMMNDPVKGAKVQKTLAYIDVANLAGWIKCPLQVCVGGEDRVCPPICGITVLNRLPKGVQKELVIDPVADHEVWETMTNANKAWRTKYLLNK
jgi:cephalosporin-C deacetylase-like acetyl esterase